VLHATVPHHSLARPQNRRGNLVRLYLEFLLHPGQQLLELTLKSQIDGSVGKLLAQGLVSNYEAKPEYRGSSPLLCQISRNRLFLWSALYRGGERWIVTQRLLLLFERSRQRAGYVLPREWRVEFWPIRPSR
jgi:hypothetical protein